MNDTAYTLLERLSVNAGADVSNCLSLNNALLSRLRSDLSSLLNTRGLASSLALNSTPYVANSVINYGIGNIAGETLSSLAPSTLEQRIKHAIFTYEPRITRHSLQVSWIANSSEPMADLQFLIQGQLRSGMQVYPFKFRSLWNIQSGAVHVDSPDGAQLHG